MNKITVMVEKEIDIEELIKKLEDLDIVDYDEYEGDPISQHDTHSEVLAVLNNVSKVMYEKDEEFRKVYTASQELQTKLNESEERLKCAKKQIAELEERVEKSEHTNEAKYLYDKLKELNPCERLQPRKNVRVYIDELLSMYKRLNNELSRRIAFKPCPDCFGRQYEKDATACLECVHKEKCKAFYEEQKDA